MPTINRQQQAAHHADLLEHFFPHLWLSRLTPASNTGEALNKLKSSILREKLAPAGIWSIETGDELGKLHLNIISPRLRDSKIIPAGSYSEPINSRAAIVAAYITKRESIPQPQQYAGRCYGYFGQLLGAIKDQRTAPIVQAAIIQQQIISALPDIAAALPTPYLDRQAELEAAARDRHKGIARKHLATFYGALRAIEKNDGLNR